MIKVAGNIKVHAKRSSSFNKGMQNRARTELRKRITHEFRGWAKFA